MLDGSAKILLIVEDDDAFRDRLTRSMQRRGFNVCSVASVMEALSAIQEDVPDYAVVDLRLLDGNGLDVVSELEDKHAETRAIILTGYGDISTAVSAVRLGAVDYIAKPATADEIIDALLAPKGSHASPPDNPIQPEQARLEHIEYVFHRTGDNVSQAAKLLKMHRRSLQRVLKRNGLSKGSAD